MRLAEDIKNGRLDDELAEIAAAVEYRQNKQTDEWRELLKEGDKVAFVDEISPKYLAGLKGTISGKTGSRVMVALDETSRDRIRGRRFDYDGDVYCYPTHLKAAPKEGATE